MRALVTTLLGLAIAACSGESKTERSGEVIAASGEVSVVRGDADPAPLSVGDRVTGSDRVRTGEGAEVKIKLAHNGVTLVYGGGVDVRLSKAPGWSASGDVSAGVLEGDPDDKTTAAGVNSETEAASDPRTALANETKSAETVPESPKTDPKTGGSESDSDSTTGKVGAANVTGGGDKGKGYGGGDKGKGFSSDDNKDKEGGSGKGPRTLGERQLSQLQPPRVSVSGASDPVGAIVRKVLSSRALEMRRCFETKKKRQRAAQTVKLVLAVSGGKLLPASIEVADGARGCIAAVIRSIPVPEKLEAEGVRATITGL